MFGIHTIINSNMFSKSFFLISLCFFLATACSNSQMSEQAQVPEMSLISTPTTKVTTYYNDGISYLDLGKYDEAIKAFTKAIELDPGTSAIYYNRGTAYFVLEDYQKAIDDYSKAIKLDPSDAWAHSNRGAAYDELGEHRKAIDRQRHQVSLSELK